MEIAICAASGESGRFVQVASNNPGGKPEEDSITGIAGEQKNQTAANA